MVRANPPPEVVPLVSSPAEDRAQPTPEQVAPPTATDVGPELSSSGDNTPLSAAEVWDSVNISVSSNPVTSGSKPKAHRKRNRVNGDTARNVKNKSTKAACPESPRDTSPPVASNDDIAISPRIPRRRRGETRYTAAKQQLNDALDETVRLKTVIKLLESEIDLKNKVNELTKLRKIDVSQKSEIKKLSILIDYQKHELHKDIATDQDVPDHDNSSSSSKACNNSTEVPVSVNRRRRKSTNVISSRQSSVSISKSVIDSDASRSQSDVQVEPSPSALPCPQVAVIGTSIVRGVGLGLNKRGVDALTFTYPGCEVPQITERNRSPCFT